MDKALSELIAISNAVGGNSSLVQGVGGNTSVKTRDGDRMYIKASGTALKDMNSRRGWRRLDVVAVESIFADKSLAAMDVNSRELAMAKRLQSACDDNVKRQARPSVESPLHAVLDRCVIHLHPLAVLSYACAKGGGARLFELFAEEEFPPLWVRYADPGFSLGRRLHNLVRRNRKQFGRPPAIMFLEKHGLIVAANTPNRALQLLRKVIKRCKSGLTMPAPRAAIRIKQRDTNRIARSIEKNIQAVGGKKVNVTYFADKTVSAILAGPDAKGLTKAPPLTPDEMGFVASPIMWLDDAEPENVANRLRACLGEGQAMPTAFLVDNVGLFVVGNAKLAGIVGDIVAGSLFVRSNAQCIGGINGLNKRQRNFIENWEAEKFRIHLAGK